VAEPCAAQFEEDYMRFLGNRQGELWTKTAHIDVRGATVDRQKLSAKPRDRVVALVGMRSGVFASLILEKVRICDSLRIARNGGFVPRDTPLAGRSS
jgi:hypothetical protein